MKPNVVDWIAWVILVIGGLNWGLIGFFSYDVVENVFANLSGFARVVYAIVGIAAIYSIVTVNKWSSAY